MNADFDLITYLGACFVMGLGIAIDVALASLARGGAFQDSRIARQWVGRITATHVAFPMLGYYAAAFLEKIPAVRPIVGVIASVLIAVFLVGMLRGLLAETDGEPTPRDGTGWALVLAVSWDALWSGPAKAAQAVNWTPLQVLLSFPIAGLVVAVAATLSTVAAGYLYLRAERLATSATRQRSAKMWGVLLEVAIFAYFGFLSLFTFTFEMHAALNWAILAATLLALGLRIAVGHDIAKRMAIPLTE